MKFTNGIQLVYLKETSDPPDPDGGASVQLRSGVKYTHCHATEVAPRRPLEDQLMRRPNGRIVTALDRAHVGQRVIHGVAKLSPCRCRVVTCVRT